MNKKIIYLIAIIIVIFIGYKLVYLISNRHRVNEDLDDKYVHLITDDSQKNINFSISFARKNRYGVFNSYVYDDKYFIVIWKINNISNNLNRVDFNTPSLLGKLQIKGETFSPDTPIPVTVKYRYHFNQGMNIRPGYKTVIDSLFESQDYKGFVGDTYRVLLEETKTGEDMILMEFKPPYNNLMLLAYSNKDDFIIITVNSTEEVGLEMLHFFTFAN